MKIWNVQKVSSTENFSIDFLKLNNFRMKHAELVYCP